MKKGKVKKSKENVKNREEIEKKTRCSLYQKLGCHGP